MRDFEWNNEWKRWVASRAECARVMGSNPQKSDPVRVHPFDITDEYLDDFIDGEIVEVSDSAESVYFQEDAVLEGYHQVLDFELFAPFNLTPTKDWVGKRLQIKWDDDGNTLTHVKFLGIQVELRL